MPTSRLPDYSHLAPKIGGSERLDVAVAAVAQAASAAAAAAAAAVISAAGDQIRAHMQVCQLAMPLVHQSQTACCIAGHSVATCCAIVWNELYTYLLLLHVQACPPQGFPFFGLPPSMLAQLSLQHLQPQVRSSLQSQPSQTGLQTLRSKQTQHVHARSMS